MLENTFLRDKSDVLKGLCLRLSDLWIHYKQHCHCVHLHEWGCWNTDEWWNVFLDMWMWHKPRGSMFCDYLGRVKSPNISTRSTNSSVHLYNKFGDYFILFYFNISTTYRLTDSNHWTGLLHSVYTRVLLVRYLALLIN